MTKPGLDWIDHDPMKDLHAKKLSLIQSGRDVIDLSMINPDIAPPRLLMDKLLEATVRPINHRYAVARGIRRLRDAFAQKYSERFGVRLSGEHNVCVTMGSKDAIEHALMALGSEGESVLVGAPAYPTFISAIKLARMEVEYFDIDQSQEKMLAQIGEIIKRTKIRAIILNFPNNPTGVSVNRKFYADLADLVSNAGITVINDFVYGEMDYDGRGACSMLSVPFFAEHGAEVYSLSKAYSVPGWRVGAMLGSPALVAKLARLKAHVDYGIFLPLQVAAAAGLSAGPNLIAPIVQEYAERSKLLSQGLTNLGWMVDEHSAGTSIWAAAPNDFAGTSSSLSLAARLLDEALVAVSPAEAFPSADPRGDKARVRFALVASQAKLREVLSRLRMLSKPAQALPA